MQISLFVSIQCLANKRKYGKLDCIINIISWGKLCWSTSSQENDCSGYKFYIAWITLNIIYVLDSCRGRVVRAVRLWCRLSRVWILALVNKRLVNCKPSSKWITELHLEQNYLWVNCRFSFSPRKKSFRKGKATIYLKVIVFKLQLCYDYFCSF